MKRDCSGYHFYEVEATDDSKSLDTTGSPEEAFITLSGQIRYRMDGGNPTAILGHLMFDGMSLRLTNVGQLSKFRFVRSIDRPTFLSVTLEKE